MIEFLSGENWINPQIDFLLFLQNIRTSHFECLNRFFLSVTILGEIWLPAIICSIIYFSIDSKKGLYLFSLFGFELCFSQLFKMLACVYRPWILSDKINPVELAIKEARGYSFPSGHTLTATTILGGIAYSFRKNKILSIFLIIVIFFVGFSRMWLGVHTPQDVLIGLITGGFLVFILDKIINKIDKDKKMYLKLLIPINLTAILILFYIIFLNQYPKDYVDGKLLVDPIHAIESFTYCWGYSLGVINGGFICRAKLPYDAKCGSLKTKILRGMTGSIGVFVILKIISPFILSFNSSLISLFSTTFISGFIITFIFPLIFLKAEKRF